MEKKFEDDSFYARRYHSKMKITYRGNNISKKDFEISEDGFYCYKRERIVKLKMIEFEVKIHESIFDSFKTIETDDFLFKGNSYFGLVNNIEAVSSLWYKKEGYISFKKEVSAPSFQCRITIRLLATQIAKWSKECNKHVSKYAKKKKKKEGRIHYKHNNASRPYRGGGVSPR